VALAVRTQLAVRYLDAGLPLGLNDVGFDNFDCAVPEQRAAVAHARGFVEHYRAGHNLILTGAALGKTHLLVAVTKHVAARGAMVRYLNAADLLTGMTETGYGRQSESAVLLGLVGPSLLVIDHIGDVPWTRHLRTLFLRVINARCAAGVATAIATHTDVAQLQEDIGERTLRRLWVHGDELVTLNQKVHRSGTALRSTAEFDRYLNPSKE
jgi:DNA replication protein DnaC